MGIQGIIQVRHLVPVVGRRKGTRKDAVALDVGVTPARIVEVGAREMRRVGRITRPFGIPDVHEIHEMGGVLWTPIRASRDANISGADLVAFLDGTGDGSGSIDMAKAFARSPLSSPDAPGSGVRSAALDRDGFVASFDGMARAVAGIGPWLDRTVRLAGGVPYVRVPGPTAQLQILGAPGVYAGAVHPMAMVRYDGHVPIDGIPGDWVRRLGTGEIPFRHRRERPRLVGVEGLDGRIPDDSHLDIAINQGLTDILGQVAYAAAKMDPAVRGAVTDVTSRLQPATALAWIGALAGRELDDVARELALVTGLVREHCDAATPGAKRVAAAHGFLGDVVIPGLAARAAAAMPAADAAALSGLAP